MKAPNRTLAATPAPVMGRVAVVLGMPVKVLRVVLICRMAVVLVVLTCRRIVNSRCKDGRVDVCEGGFAVRSRRAETAAADETAQGGRGCVGACIT